MGSVILNQLYSLYWSGNVKCGLSADGNTLCILPRTILGSEMVTLEFMIIQDTNDYSHFTIMVFGIGSITKIINNDGNVDERSLLNMINRFNSNHRTENISLKMDREGNFMVLSEKKFYGLSNKATIEDVDKVFYYIGSLQTFIEQNYKELKKIVKYFG